MFGQTLFAEVPFSVIGQPPFVDTGWHDSSKRPCDLAGWTKLDKNKVDIYDCGPRPANWTVIK